MNSGSRGVIAILALAAIGGAAFWWSQQPTEGQQTTPQAAIPAVAPDAAPALASQPAIAHPLAARQPGTGRIELPPLDESDRYIENALADLLGVKAIRLFVNPQGIARRFVATVDNLANASASASLWPVNQTSGTFDAETLPDDAAAISARNARRYTPFVRFVAAIDTPAAVALYVRLYPLFQQTYEDLGYPGKYFNDRVVEVIDHLLATPEMRESLGVKRVIAAGALEPPNPGRGLFQFADPELEAKSAGQKILMRVGQENAGILKAKLAEIRQRISAGPAAHNPAPQ